MKIRNQVKKVQVTILSVIMCLVIPAGCAGKQTVVWDEDDLSNLNQFNIVQEETETASYDVQEEETDETLITEEATEEKPEESNSAEKPVEQE